MRLRHLPYFLLCHPACVWAPGPLLLSSSSTTYSSFLSSFSPSSSLSHDGGESNVVPTSSALTRPPSPQMQPRDSCDVVNNGPPYRCSFPRTAGSQVVVKIISVGSVSSGQPFCFAVAHSTTQSISSHWKHQRNTYLKKSHNITQLKCFLILNDSFFSFSNPL